jgi:hypothetical protein
MAQEATPTAPAGQEPEAKPGQEPAATPESKPAEEPRTFDEAYVKKLRDEAAEQRTKTKALEAKVKEFEDRDKSETERLTERLQGAETRAETAEAKVLRFEIAADRGLELKAAEFLSGSNREEIEAKADELSQMLADRNKTKTPGFDAGARQTPPTQKEPGEAHNDFLLQAMGRGSQ